MRCSLQSYLSFCLVIACPLPIYAQTEPDYHLEFLYPHTMSDGSVLSEAALVNDSNKAIETFHISSECQLMGGVTQDALDNVSNESTITLVGNQTFRQNAVIEPHAQFISIATRDLSKRGVPLCAPKIDAILFLDGTYEGDEAVLRGIEAHRRGMTDGVTYWINRLLTSRVDRSALEALNNEAQQRTELFYKEEDALKHQSLQIDIPWQYHAGRILADRIIMNTLGKGLRNDVEVSKIYKETTSYFIEWKNKIDNDAASRELASAFPLPENLVTQGSKFR
jgi:hypothetical protein